MDPLHAFRFRLSFERTPLTGSAGAGPDVCGGAFSECTGLEATMEPKVIKEGGRNYGAAQRVGPVTFGTVVLKRGIAPGGDLYKWFAKASRGDRGYRLSVTVALHAPGGAEVMRWRLENALPVKFKAADFNARASEVGIEELHLAHEGLTLL